MVNVDRREFLGLSAAGTLAGLTAATIGAPGTAAYAATAGRKSYEAIVVGSGFGGAVAALRLGQAGVDTLVLERGREWVFSDTEKVFGSQNDYNNKMFWQRNVANWPVVPPFPMTKATGVMEVSDEKNITVACGAGVGGGSLVYTGATVAPPQKYWEQLYPSFSWNEFQTKWFPLVRRMLNVSPMPDDIYNSAPFTHSRIWDKHARASGYEPVKLDSVFSWDKIRLELAGKIRPSAIAGESDFGNSNGSKQGLQTNYLPAAVATGKVRIQALAEVTAIKRNLFGKWQLVVTQRDVNNKVLATDTYECNKLFLCAGTLNTNRLLVAARESGALPLLSSSIGTGFGDNGDQYAGYSYTGDPAGPTQAAPSASTIFHDTEFGIPIRTENWQLLSAQGAPILQTLSMTADFEGRGKFVYDSKTKKVSLDFSADNALRAAEAASAARDKIMRGAKGAIPIGITWPFTLTAHPLGGVVLGQSTDWAGRVKGYKNLYCLDGSLIPGTIGGANPTLSITAIAEKSIAAIIAAGG